MPLDDQNPISNNFNRNAERDVQNRISPYNLTASEKAQVWQIVEERNNNIETERTDFKENWKERFDIEVNRLRAKQKPQLQYNMGNRQLPTQAQLRNQAQRNIQTNHLNKLRGYEHDADNQIHAILDKARDEGRGSELQQKNKSLNQDISRQSDRDKY